MLLLLVLFVFVVNYGVSCERLPEHRKSCNTKTILIESSNRKKVDKVFTSFPRESVWQEAINVECKNSDVGKHDKRERSGVSKKLSEKPFYRGFSSAEDNRILDFESAKMIVRDVLNKKVAESRFLDAIRPMVAVKLENHTEPTIRLSHNLFTAKCFIGETLSEKLLQLKVTVMMPEELAIWRCDDIGRNVNNTYEFYEFGREWMVEGDNGTTFSVDLQKCTNTNEQLFCSPKAFATAGCSVNNLQLCRSPQVVTPVKSQYSFSRLLYDGVAIYGKFKEWAKHHKNEQSSFLINPGLYYFKYQNSTSEV